MGKVKRAHPTFLNPDAVKEFYVIPDTGVLPHLELPAIVTNLLQVSLASWEIC